MDLKCSQVKCAVENREGQKQRKKEKKKEKKEGRKEGRKKGRKEGRTEERKNGRKKEKKLRKFKLPSPAQVKQKNVCLISLKEKTSSRCRNHQ